MFSTIAFSQDNSLKKETTHELYQRLIKKQKGKHFDPELADLFLSIKPKILEVRKRFPN